MTITFKVSGVPVTKGSVRAFVPRGSSRPIVTADAPGLRGWEAAVRHEAQRHISRMYPDGVTIWMQFVLKRPKALPRLRPRAHVTRPDLDKLARAAIDGLTGVAFQDDSQVIEAHLSKRYAELLEPLGVVITLAPGVPESAGPPLLFGLDVQGRPVEAIS
jgi:crossover junction endodeoxyribonuclease RusA